MRSIFLFCLLVYVNANADIERLLDIENGVNYSDGSIGRDIYRYHFIKEKKTFDEAEEECNRKGILGHLVSILDASENAFVSRLPQRLADVSITSDWHDTQNFLYIGLRRHGHKWSWSDGRDVMYANWHPSAQHTNSENVSLNCVALIPGDDVANGYHTHSMPILCSSFTKYSVCKTWKENFGQAIMRDMLERDIALPQDIKDAVEQHNDKIKRAASDPNAINHAKDFSLEQTDILKRIADVQIAWAAKQTGPRPEPPVIVPVVPAPVESGTTPKPLESAFDYMTSMFKAGDVVFHVNT